MHGKQFLLCANTTCLAGKPGRATAALSYSWTTICADDAIWHNLRCIQIR